MPILVVLTGGTTATSHVDVGDGADSVDVSSQRDGGGDNIVVYNVGDVCVFV